MTLSLSIVPYDQYVNELAHSPHPNASQNRLITRGESLLPAQPQQKSLSMLDNLPWIDINICKFLHELGLSLIKDDRMDVGYTQYFGRESHYYRGQQSPDHPSPFHHYQIGVISMAAATGRRNDM